MTCGWEIIFFQPKIPGGEVVQSFYFHHRRRWSKNGLGELSIQSILKLNKITPLGRGPRIRLYQIKRLLTSKTCCPRTELSSTAGTFPRRVIASNAGTCCPLASAMTFGILKEGCSYFQFQSIKAFGNWLKLDWIFGLNRIKRLQGGWGGWPTGNGKKLSSCQAQLGQATWLAVA